MYSHSFLFLSSILCLYTMLLHMPSISWPSSECCGTMSILHLPDCIYIAIHWHLSHCVTHCIILSSHHACFIAVVANRYPVVHDCLYNPCHLLGYTQLAGCFRDLVSCTLCLWKMMAMMWVCVEKGESSARDAKLSYLLFTTAYLGAVFMCLSLVLYTISLSARNTLQMKTTNKPCMLTLIDIMGGHKYCHN